MMITMLNFNMVFFALLYGLLTVSTGLNLPVTPGVTNKTMRQDMELLTSYESEEWFTPPEHIELARSVLGGIDLDPASHSIPQEWIRATRYYTKAEDGLAQPWGGRIFLNPPYGKIRGKSLQAVWSTRLATCYRYRVVPSAILLINSTHGYKWYEDLWTNYPVCCLRERISFIRPDGSNAGEAKRGQTVIYFGTELERFSDTYAPYGRILLP